MSFGQIYYIATAPESTEASMQNEWLLAKSYFKKNWRVTFGLRMNEKMNDNYYREDSFFLFSLRSTEFYGLIL